MLIPTLGLVMFNTMEYIANEFPNTIVSKWWKRYVCDRDPWEK